MTEDLQQALITMKATQLKVIEPELDDEYIKAKGKMVYSHRLPIVTYNLSTVQQSNEKGIWFGWNVAMIGPVQDENLYGAAKAFAINA